MKLEYREARNRNRSRSGVVFFGGTLTGVMIVIVMMNSQNQLNNTIILSDASSIVTETRVKYLSVPTPSSPGDIAYERAFRDSGGFFDDIPDEQWARMKARVRSRTNHFDPTDSKRNIMDPEAWYQENFEPDFTCSHERRIGGMGDGPKWVCDPHRLMPKNGTQNKDCLVYSVGSEGNFLFENAVLNEIGKNCEIHTFDPEIQGIAYGHLAPKGISYHNWGFMGETGSKLAKSRLYSEFSPPRTQQGNLKTMKDTIELLGHVGREIDIFKIDCEGCEWTTFRGWLNSGATLKQILVEVHKTPLKTTNDFFLSMQENGYVTFHKEANIQWTGGTCVEYAFLKLENSFFGDV